MTADAAEVSELAACLGAAARVVAFTGAGMSTDSGVPDFRSPGGLWTRYDPRDLTFDRYVRDPEVRRRSWAMRREMWEARPRPHAGHEALADLERAGRVMAVVTQNIDGLHQDAGSQRVIELHGTMREVMCIGRPVGGVPTGCGWRARTTWAFEAIDAGEEDPACPECGALVKSATVSFGQSLFPGVLEEAADLVQRADLLLTVGSSLQVYPAAGLPELAARAGARVAIVNDEPTPADELAEVVVRGRAGEVLPAAAVSD